MPDVPIETQPLPEATEPAPAENPSPDPADKPLGEAGEKALRAERKRVAELEKALKEQGKKLDDVAPLLEIVKGLHGSVPGVDPTDPEKLTAENKQLKAENEKERLARLRLEVAIAAELPMDLAARLQGTTAEELKADAEALKALIPTQTTPEAPQGPRGDPAQGARPGGTSGGIQSGAARYEARKKQPPTF